MELFSQVNIRYTHVFPKTNISEGLEGQAGQDAFNREKVKANETRNELYNRLKTVNWFSYQASTGLELKDKDVSNFNLGQVEAYCSADGAVVRKCDKGATSCNKKEGEVTKCSKY